MLLFTRKFQFNASQLAAVTAHTFGATDLGGGLFEAAADGPLPLEGLVEVPLSQQLQLRITAKDDVSRMMWGFRVLAHLGETATADVTQRGYWAPTDEYEPSWLISTDLEQPTPQLLDLLYEWMVDQDQEAVYLEYQGQVLILDRDEVPQHAAAAA